MDADLLHPTESPGMAILRQQVAASSKAQVAEDLGYSRTAISLHLAGKYSGSGDRIERAAIAFYDARRRCPHLQVELTGGECRRYATQPFTTHNPARVRHLRACQRCPHKPEAI